MKKIAIISTIFMVFLLSCTNKIEEIIDRIPPVVSITSPAHGETGVSVTSSIIVTFSEIIDSSSVNTNKIEITPSLNYNLSVNETKLFIIPVQPLREGIYYTVKIKKGIKDLSGNEMESDYTFTFRVRGSDKSKSRVVFLVRDVERHYPRVYIFGTWNKYGEYSTNYQTRKRYLMYDDGAHEDEEAGDGIWGYITYLAVDNYNVYKWYIDIDEDESAYVKEGEFSVLNSAPLKVEMNLYPPVPVTFNFYDSGNLVNESIYVTGDFDNWSISHKMEGPYGSERKFTAVVYMLEGKHYYKYFADGSWNKLNINNREVTVVYGSNNVVNDYSGRSIKFYYHDIETNVSSSIYLRGDFNGWGYDNKMSLYKSTPYPVYTNSVNLISGVTYRYKYYVDGDWDKVNKEDRSYTPQSTDTEHHDYFKGDRLITFRYHDNEGKVKYSIHIRGDFNGWALSYEYQLTRVSESEPIYEIQIPLSDGEYKYKYYVDDDWNKVNTSDRTVTVSATNNTIIDDYYQN